MLPRKETRVVNRIGTSCGVIIVDGHRSRCDALGERDGLAVRNARFLTPVVMVGCAGFDRAQHLYLRARAA